MPEVLTTIPDVRKVVAEARATGKRIGVVPTMGALHEGHLSLIDECRKHADLVIVTIFVNPTQFAPGEDLDKYPRPFEDDVALCGERGADYVFHPAVDVMYSQDASTWVNVTGISERLEGQHRPSHFQGVTTVVAKLFNITQPDVACFGRKDYQQQLLIRKMVTDLDMPVEIVTCATIREPDGLAMSSRNRYLSADERSRSLRLWTALCHAQERLNAGESDLDAIRRQMTDVLEADSAAVVDYVSIADRETLEELNAPRAEMIGLIAAHVGQTRLIDNLPLISPVED